MKEINRKGTESAIKWLEEESYKELFEKAKNIIFSLQYYYDCEQERNIMLYEENEELKQENEELKAEWKKLMREVYKNIQFQKSLEKYVEKLEKEEQ